MHRFMMAVCVLAMFAAGCATDVSQRPVPTPPQSPPSYAPPQQAAPPTASAPQAPLLTTQEQFCKFYGEVASAIVVDRDRLTPLTTTVERVRKIVMVHLREYPLESQARVMGIMSELANTLYTTSITSAQARHAFEIGCLNPESTETRRPQKSPLY